MKVNGRSEAVHTVQTPGYSFALGINRKHAGGNYELRTENWEQIIPLIYLLPPGEKKLWCKGEINREASKENYVLRSVFVGLKSGNRE